MKKLRLENWKSTTNLQEKHWFKGSINRGKYVFGLNPHLFSKEFIQKTYTFFLEELKRTKKI